MSKEKSKDIAQELNWIDFCYEELLGSAGLQPQIKEFNEGYFKVRKIIKASLELNQ